MRVSLWYNFEVSTYSNTFLESFKVIKKCSYFYESIFIRKPELISWRPPVEDSNDVLTGMVNW